MNETAPETVVEAIQACREYVRRATGVELDLTPDTLPLLDYYSAGLARESARERPELLALLARTLGFYFGEVVRRRIPSFWRLPLSGNVVDIALCSRVAYLWQNPIGVAYDAIVGSPEHDGPSSNIRVLPEEHNYLAERLNQLPPVAEEEFFSFSTRFEVLEVAIEALRARLTESGQDGIEFDEDDYEFGLRPLPL